MLFSCSYVYLGGLQETTLEPTLTIDLPICLFCHSVVCRTVQFHSFSEVMESKACCAERHEARIPIIILPLPSRQLLVQRRQHVLVDGLVNTIHSWHSFFNLFNISEYLSVTVARRVGFMFSCGASEVDVSILLLLGPKLPAAVNAFEAESRPKTLIYGGLSGGVHCVYGSVVFLQSHSVVEGLRADRALE